MLVRLVPFLKTSLVLFEKILLGQHVIIAETGTVKAKRQSNYGILILFMKNVVTQSSTGLQIYEGRDDQLNRPGPMA
jgi:hypothetical protein